MRSSRRLAGFALALLALLIVAGALLGETARGLAQESEKSVLGNLLSRALSTPASRVSIGAVEGALSSDAVIRDVTVSDRDGVWLRLDRARLVWRRLALIQKRLEIDSLEIGHLEVLRRPVAGPTPPEAKPDGALLPELPVKVEVRQARLDALVLGEGVAGQAAILAGQGKARLGDPSEGLDLDLSARRLDAPGQFALRLLYVPEGAKLELNATLKEAAGGLLSRAANIPATPPIALDLTGRGTLDAWNATLAFDAGPQAGAQGTASITRTGSERRLALDLAARVEQLVPGPLAAVFAGTTRLDGTVGFADDGALTLDGLALASRTARLAAGGRVGADRVADLTLQARALPTDGTLTRAGEAEIDRLAFDGRLAGPLTAPSVHGVLDVAGLRTRTSRLDRVEARLDLAPDAAGQGRFALTADGRVAGLHPADPALARALGPEATLSLRAGIGPDGIADVTTLRLDARTARLAYAGRLGQNVLEGRLEAALPDLAAFSGIAGRDLSGRLDASARLTGDPARRALSADLTLAAHALATGEAALDRALGRDPTLAGRVSQTYDGYGFDRLRLDGSGVSAALQGSATGTAADVTGRVELKSLAALDGRLTGRAVLDGRLAGSLERPDLTATLSVPEGSAEGQRFRALRAEIAARDLTGAVDATLALSGTVAERALTGGAHLARLGPDWALDRLAFDLGSVSLSGTARVAAETGATVGRLALKAGNLADLSALALTPLAGRLDAAVTLAREGGRQDASVRATGEGVRVGAVSLARLDADLAGRDLRARPVLNGHLAADGMLAAGTPVETLRLAATGTDTASDVTLSARARGFDLDGAARVVPGARTRIELQRLAAVHGRDRVALAGPATLTLGEGGARVEGLALAAGGGRLTAEGRVGPDLDLRLAARNLPLALARVAVPDLALEGTLDGEAILRGPPTRPEGRYALTLSRFAAAQTRGAGLPSIDATAQGTLNGAAATLAGQVTGGRGLALTLSGTLPIVSGGPLDLHARGSLDAALANTVLSTSGQSLAGRIAVDAAVAGTLAAPRAGGSATLAGGRFDDPLNGIRLTGIEARATGRGDAVVLERLTAQARNGGQLSAQGRVAVDPAAGFPGSFRVTAERAELVSSPAMTAVASLDLTLSGPLARTPRVAGRIDVASIDVTVPDRLPATVQPLPNVRRVNTPPAVRARLATRPAPAAARGRKGRRPAPPFDATLDLTIDAPGRIFVRGRGIDAELGGRLRVTGFARDPNAVGDFAMRRGRLALAGQRLDFTRGRLAFAGALATPDLDFAAESKAADVTARVAVTGPADQPLFTLTSDPSLPQDEILSRLIFKKAAAGLSPFQALQLAQAVAQLSGGAGGPDAFDAARKSLGLDSLDVSTGASGGPALGASRAISDRVSVGVKAGAKPEDTAVGIAIDVTRRLRVQGEAGSDGRTSLGLGAEWEW